MAVDGPLQGSAPPRRAVGLLGLIPPPGRAAASTGAHLLHPGYRRRGWHRAGPGFGQGIRPRVGVHHLALADLVGAALASGLTLTRLEEPGAEDYPLLIALQLRR